MSRRVPAANLGALCGLEAVPGVAPPIGFLTVQPAALLWC